MTGLTRRTVLQAGVAALAAPVFLRSARAAERTVNVFNWADYIGETVVADFEAASGIKVVYDSYDSAEAAEAKLMAGSSGYDLVVTASRNLPRFARAGIMKPLDRSKLTNWGHLDETLLAILAKLDPDNAHAVPYMWGTTGVTYNTTLVDKNAPGAPYNSFDMLFKPEIAEKLQGCGINMIDSPGTIIPMVLAYLGKDPLSEDPKDLEAVVDAFMKVRKDIRSFDNNQYTAQLATQEICVSTNWAGDYASASLRAKEAGLDVKLRYVVPDSGGTLWLDAFIIPTDAPNVEEAHTFLNYMLQPEVIAKCTDYTAYANANKDAKSLIKKEILQNTAVYPDAEVMKRVWLPKDVSPEYDSLRTRAWAKIMTGS